MPLAQRLEAGAIPEPNTGCWLWTKVPRKPDGSGCISIKGRTLKVSRVSYEFHIGPIPPGMEVCHRCDTPACINPSHLFLGTHSDNMSDCTRKGRNRGRSRINSAHALAIRLQYASGRSSTHIAAEFGICPHQVWVIARGRSWASAGGPITGPREVSTNG